jgi:hypothetical protein
MCIIGPLIETFILVKSLNICLKTSIKIKPLLFFLSCFWGILHAIFVGFNAFIPVTFIFLFYYDTYLKFYNKKAFIMTWIVHGVSNLIAGTIAWFMS